MLSRGKQLFKHAQQKLQSESPTYLADEIVSMTFQKCETIDVVINDHRTDVISTGNSFEELGQNPSDGNNNSFKVFTRLSEVANQRK